MISTLYSKQPMLVRQLVKVGSAGMLPEMAVHEIDIITDKLADRGMCRQRDDDSQLKELRRQSTRHALDTGRITIEQAADSLRRWGLTS